MKSTFLTVILAIAIIFLIKKGTDSAKENNEDLNFLDTIKRGVELTMKSIFKTENSKVNADETNNISTFSSLANINGSFPAYDRAHSDLSAKRTENVYRSRGLYTN